ncbi:hypothetical protein [Demequina sp. NBRC 110051]|uniref:hypothetical protein n=1 Tax=Demequina sp. NBRC 110051 TaxID=1570340 RepID=UPI0009FED2CD|nr:hypothetical protein [Demequina sp. NBRC 110051]
MANDSDRLLDDVDLITMGHVPGGAALAREAAPAHLDLTATHPAQWGACVIGEACAMVPGDCAVVVTPAPPFAMLDALYAVTGDAVMIEYLATGPDAWVSAITRID